MDTILAAELLAADEGGLASADATSWALSAKTEAVDHICARIAQSELGERPFFHLYVENIFPPAIYQAVRAFMLAGKHGSKLQQRTQDSPDFQNKRFNIAASTAPVAELVRNVFSDSKLKLALLDRFYIDANEAFARSLIIHEEFEFFFTEAGRFQNIHIDIPPKLLSFVFYVPETPLAPEDEGPNATILYDRNLSPTYQAKYRPNSVCIFAPHFHSYHGFASTRERDVLVMFYVQPAALESWRERRRAVPESPPFDQVRDAVAGKLRSHPLKEFGGSDARIAAERAACLVNAPHGRVLRP